MARWSGENITRLILLAAAASLWNLLKTREVANSSQLHVKSAAVMCIALFIGHTLVPSADYVLSVGSGRKYTSSNPRLTISPIAKFMLGLSVILLVHLVGAPFLAQQQRHDRTSDRLRLGALISSFAAVKVLPHPLLSHPLACRPPLLTLLLLLRRLRRTRPRRIFFSNRNVGSPLPRRPRVVRRRCRRHPPPFRCRLVGMAKFSSQALAACRRSAAPCDRI